MKLLERLLLAFIAFYRRFLSPLKPPTCRFHPSCSHYTRDAILHYGPLAGLWLGLKRLARCHPWHPGGYDPVVKATDPKITGPTLADRFQS